MGYVLKREAERKYIQYLKKQYSSKRAKNFSEHRKTKNWDKKPN